jgi:hypothetical protein
MKFIIILIGFLSAANILSAQWTCVGPFSGRTYSVYYNSDVIYSGLNAFPFGVYYSSDAGSSWNKMGDAIFDAISMLKAGSTFYGADRTSNRVYRTTNNGVNWDYSILGTGANTMWQLTSSGAGIFAATREGIFKSTNAGVNWTNVNAGVSQGFRSIVASGANLVAAHTTLSAGIDMSTNGGINWTNNNTISSTNMHASGNNIYASFNQSPYGVLVSTNNGSTWSNYTSGLPANNFPHDFTVMGSTIYALFNPKQVYKSTNNGQTWSLVGDITTGAITPQRITSDGTNLYTCFSSTALTGGIYKSSNNGLNWSQVGLNLFDATALGTNGSSVYYTSNGTFARSDDDGATWTQTANNNIGNGTQIVLDNNVIYVVGQGLFGRSTDNGNTFTNVLNSSTADFLKVSAANMIVITGNEMWRSTNGGTGWAPIPGTSGRQMRSLGYINGNIIAGSATIFDSSLYSTNGGVNWIPMADTGFAGVSDIVTVGNDMYAASSFGIQKSTNNGITWEYIANLPATNVDKLVYHNGFFIAATNAGIYISTNGVSWTAYNTGFPASSSINDFTIKGSYMYAAIFNGSIWKRDISTMSGIQPVSSHIPAKITLFQNYPNPFNPMTKIKFDIPSSAASSLVSLKIYNILGEEIEELVNEELKAGTYEVTWNGANHSSGIYFYKLRAGNFSETRKLVLTK